MTATVHRIREKATGRVLWIERRVGFRGLEFNAGAGWRTSIRDAIAVADDARQAAHELALAGRCSHGGHGWDGETCSDIPLDVP